ncbi:MAG: endonuclease/exonuclease/phosphatase [bacterium]|nr:endonuclease/exonuclease/phosphatase [bacterium]
MRESIPYRTRFPRSGLFLAASLLLVSSCQAGDSPTSDPQAPTAIRDIQGRDHTSPWQDRRVEEISGIVTAIDPEGGDRGFWMQDPEDDGDDATSEGLFVATAEVSAEVAVGRAVAVDGTVEESGRDAELTTTQLRASAIRIVSSGNRLPDPVVIGRDGRRPPTEVIDDGLDFYESLEGMRVEVRDAVVVGPTSRYGDVVLVADRGADASLRSPGGALVLRPDDGNPERLLVGSRLQPGDPPAVDVGGRFTAPIVGVLDYSFGNFKILPGQALPAFVRGPDIDETTRLKATENQLTVASFNVLNLSARDPEEKFSQLARVIANQLAGPDVVALQEIQDRTGPADDGVVDAAATFEALITAIEAAGGPRYAFRQVNPVDNADGGRPGGNIRVGYLFQAARVEFVDRGQAGPTDATVAETATDGLQLRLSPGRVAPEDPSFAGSRKPLAGELRFRGHKIFLINVHLKSKRGDDPLMGGRQPPQRSTESQRLRQAQVLHDFMESLLAVDPNARVVVLGDMNEHDFRPPIEALTGERWVNLLEQVPREDRFTFIYNGNAQVLDNVVISPALAAHAAPEIDVVHVQANVAHGRWASDHDPVVVRLTFD